MKMEYVITALALLAFFGFLYSRYRASKKPTSGGTPSSGAGGGNRPPHQVED